MSVIVCQECCRYVDTDFKEVVPTRKGFVCAFCAEVLEAVEMSGVELVVNEATILLVAEILKQERSLKDFPPDEDIRVSMTSAIKALEGRAKNMEQEQ